MWVCRGSRSSRSLSAVSAAGGPSTYWQKQLLIFDGSCFCQYVEGPPATLMALNDRLDLDPRHTHMEVLLEGSFAGPRRFSDWRLGYVDVVDGDEIGAMRDLSGDDAMAAFERLLPLLDVHA